MLEVAVFVANEAALKKINSKDDLKSKVLDTNEYFGKQMARIHNKYKYILDDGTITRIYFGNEFCEELIPSLEQVKIAYQKSVELELGFTFVTPYVTEYGMDKITKVLEYLNTLESNIEILCNDWGTCELVHTKYKNLTIILGRRLDKVFCDPRISEEEYEEVYNEASLAYLRRPNLFVPIYQEIMQKYSIKRVEYDCYPQGMDLSTEQEMPGFEGVSVYLPFGFVTTGRMCMMRFLNQEGGNKFDYSGPCKYACRKYNQIMKKNINVRRVNGNYVMNDTLQLYRKGNTVFYEVENFDEILENNHLINRVVYELELPI